jgi:hypothetical protein
MLHCHAHNNCEQRKDAAVCDIFERKTISKAKLPNSVHVHVQCKGRVDAAVELWSVIKNTQFGVNNLVHYYGDHLCLCGIVLVSFRGWHKENTYGNGH